MPSTADYCIWVICVLIEAAVVVAAAKSHALRRYIFLNIYMGSSVLVSVGRYQVLQRAGLGSPEYAYFYYYSDALLTIGLYFVLLTRSSLLRLLSLMLLSRQWFSFPCLTS